MPENPPPPPPPGMGSGKLAEDSYFAWARTVVTGPWTDKEKDKAIKDALK